MTTSALPDPWKKHDAERNEQRNALSESAAPRHFAFYGRCSTEDNQDPETSKQWQLRAARTLLEVHCPGAVITEVYFDVGFSRSLPWKRRPEGIRFLDDLDDPSRTWEALVVGEGKRCWYASQFNDVSPVVKHRRVPLYVPELNGLYDSTNHMHDALMTLSGSMSKGERETVRTRVHTSMSAQVEVHGRFQGGRPPYGYTAEPFAPHPNPSKAAEGRMLKRLELDPVAAPVVRRIFDDMLNGHSLRQIAHDLNTEGIPCPSAHDPKRNSHRAGDGWQHGTVDAIIRNERYTGFEQWGKFRKEESLLDPNDPGWGMKTRFVRNEGATVRSAHPVHAPIVSVEEFLHVQALRKAKSAGGLKAMAKQPRHRTTTAHYALRGMVFCTACGRRMQVDRYNQKNDDPVEPRFVRYRCRRRDLVEGSAVMATHPADVRVSQAGLLNELLGWFGDMFDAENHESVLESLVVSAGRPQRSDTRRIAEEKRLADAERGLGRLVTSIEAGVDPVLLAPRMGELNAEIEALRAALTPGSDASEGVTRERLAEMLREFSQATRELCTEDTSMALKFKFFEALRLRIDFDPETRLVRAAFHLGGHDSESSQPHPDGSGPQGGANVGVRGGT